MGAVNVDVREARPDDRPALRRLMQLYLYDFATLEGWDLGDDGLYGDARRIESFWRDPLRRSFFVCVDGELAGFVIVREGAHFAGEGTREISEFFVLRRYRRRRVGEEVARSMFDAFPGRWEVAETARNVEAQAFWRAVIGRYTRGRYEELARPDGNGVVQRFDNSAG
jgi:predicted acetyltransferase